MLVWYLGVGGKRAAQSGEDNFGHVRKTPPTFPLPKSWKTLVGMKMRPSGMTELIWTDVFEEGLLLQANLSRKPYTFVLERCRRHAVHVPRDGPAHDVR